MCANLQLRSEKYELLWQDVNSQHRIKWIDMGDSIHGTSFTILPCYLRRSQKELKGSPPAPSGLWLAFWKWQRQWNPIYLLDFNSLGKKVVWTSEQKTQKEEQTEMERITYEHIEVDISSKRCSSHKACVESSWQNFNWLKSVSYKTQERGKKEKGDIKSP